MKIPFFAGIFCSVADPDPVFLGHPDPDPDPGKKFKDPDPSSTIIFKSQNNGI